MKETLIVPNVNPKCTRQELSGLDEEKFNAGNVIPAEEPP